MSEKPMIDSITVVVGDTWTCHVCGRVRKDADIGVRHVELSPPPIPVIANVRYCLDTQSCFDGAESVDFVKSARKAFAKEDSA